MDRVKYLKPDFPVDAFAGTATYYVRYRVPYPEQLLKDLIERAGITGKGRLLDLACGPGRVSLALVSSFPEVWAIDLEPEMIEAGHREATQQGVKNIKWMVGRVEDLEAPRASFELITIGEAFHRLDQQLVTKQTLQWLKPGCCLAIIGCLGVVNGKEPWQRIVADVVRQWTGRDFSNRDVSTQPKPGSGSHNVGPHFEGLRARGRRPRHPRASVHHPRRLDHRPLLRQALYDRRAGGLPHSNGAQAACRHP